MQLIFCDLLLFITDILLWENMSFRLKFHLFSSHFITKCAQKSMWISDVMDKNDYGRIQVFLKDKLEFVFHFLFLSL